MSVNNNSGTGLGVLGAILGISGGIMCYYGNQINHNIERQFTSFWNTGSRDSTGELLFYGGIAMVVIGVILILVNVIQYFTAEKMIIDKTADISNGGSIGFWECSKCGRANSNSVRFCECGNSRTEKYLDNTEKYKMWKCPNCLRSNYYYVGTCACGTVKPTSKSEKTEETFDQKETNNKIINNNHENKFCVNCGAKLSKSAKFCATCGIKCE